MNGITMWRLDPEFYGRNRSRTHVAMLTSTRTCTNRANSRRSDSGQTMAKQGQTTNQGLEGLTAAAKDAAGARATRKKPPPPHLWGTPFFARLPMRNSGARTPLYTGTPLRRPALLRV